MQYNAFNFSVKNFNRMQPKGMRQSINMLKMRIDNYVMFVRWPALERSLQGDLDQMLAIYKERTKCQ